MPSAWRIVKAKHAGAAFDGEGARVYGGRWNSRGAPLVYLAESRALALLEVLVHLHDASLLEHYVRFEVGYHGRLCTQLDRDELPAGWNGWPAPVEAARVGDEWVAARRSVLLRVPSAIVPEEHLLLLNPAHPDVDKLVIGAPERLGVDARLL